jgi:hypothetical protein
MLTTYLLLQAGAVKSKRQRSVGREGSPAVEGSRVSKRQKAKADAQAAETAQLQEAEEQAAEEDDPFSGAATQVACLVTMQILLSFRTFVPSKTACLCLIARSMLACHKITILLFLVVNMAARCNHG